MKEDQINENAFQPIDEADLDLCRALWVSVALQAVIDARSNSKKREFVRSKEEALEWLNAEKEEESPFALVCDLAGIDFKEARKRLLTIVDSPNELADFRCIKKALLDNRGHELRSKYLGRMRRQQRLREKQRREKHIAA